MAKKMWMNQSERQAHYWAGMAYLANTKVCGRHEFAVWRFFGFELLKQEELKKYTSYSGTHTRVRKIYKVSFEADRVFITIEGDVPAYGTKSNSWWPVEATIHSWMRYPTKVFFGDDRKVSHLSMTYASRWPRRQPEVETPQEIGDRL